MLNECQQIREKYETKSLGWKEVRTWMKSTQHKKKEEIRQKFAN